jgi:hypothetical protein
MNVTGVETSSLGDRADHHLMSEWGEAEYRRCGQVFIALMLVFFACAGGGVWLFIR